MFGDSPYDYMSESEKAREDAEYKANREIEKARELKEFIEKWGEAPSIDDAPLKVGDFGYKLSADLVPSRVRIVSVMVGKVIAFERGWGFSYEYSLDSIAFGDVVDGIETDSSLRTKTETFDILRKHSDTIDSRIKCLVDL